MYEPLLKQIKSGDIKSFARAISFIENQQPGYENLLQSISYNFSAKIIGITGPPGAGKSTLTDALIGEMVKENKKVAVLCVDPSSAFNHGALLGDRIRMNEWHNQGNVFIRSLATRGSMGGLSPMLIEITDLIQWAGFENIIIETVGVGQSEIEIAGLADITIVVVVPESGDEIQTMKAGLMEIADIFVINKCDKPEAELLERNLRFTLTPAFARQEQEIPVIKTIATEKKGVSELYRQIMQSACTRDKEKQYAVLAEKAWHLILSRRMRNISKENLLSAIRENADRADFNLYRFVDNIS